MRGATTSAALLVAMAAATGNFVVAAADAPCSLTQTVLTARCGHVVAVSRQTQICPYQPASCAAFATGTCFDSTGTAPLTYIAHLFFSHSMCHRRGYWKCSYSNAKCSAATAATFNDIFAKVDNENSDPFDVDRGVKSYAEVGDICYDAAGNTTGAVVLARQDRYCVVDTKCQTQPNSTTTVRTAQVLLDIPRIQGTGSFNNLSIVGLGPDLSMNAWNQSLDDATNLEIRFSQLTSIANTKFPRNLSSLNVNFNKIATLGNLSQNAPSVTFLSAASNSLTSLDNVMFPRQLTTLSLLSNQLQGTLAGAALPSSLEFLYLAQNQYTQVIGPLPASLMTIDLGSNLLRVFDASTLGGNVTLLQLSNNTLTQMRGMFPPSLQTLDLSSNQLADLPAFSKQANLTLLNLARNPFPWTAASAFPAIVTTLNLSNTPIQNAILNASQLPSTIVTLDLTNCKITTIVGAFPPALQKLYLDGNALGTWTLSSNAFRTLNSLTWLSLPSTPTTFNCTALATKALPNGFQVCIQDLLPSPNNTPASTSPSSSSNAPVYAVVAGGIIILALVGGYFVYQRRRSERFSDEMDDDDGGGDDAIGVVEIGTAHAASTAASLRHFDGGGGGSSKRFDLGDEFNQFRIPMREVEILQPLLRPDQAEARRPDAATMLYKARFNERFVVLKTLTTEEPSAVSADFLQTIRLRSTFDHPHVVGFVGVVWSSNARLTGYGLLLEHLPRGDLARVLAFDAQKTDKLLQWRPSLPTVHPKTSLLLDIASAIVYLHSFVPPAMHRNLQSRSILLSDAWEAKVNGFKTSPSWVAPELITAPEVLRGEAWTEKADIYSFGILICELDLGRHPYVNEKNPENDRQIATLVKADLLQPTFSVECPVEIQDIAKKCLAFDRAARPAAVEMEFWIRKFKRTHPECCN
ncbi:Aste57867_16001 [Aphanomyces stellatus]|uniref:non-specific serine/threonine protein kinase n=1 Tax=Aphanomyces stellatus TaxID=120398 RepID=A0A485L5S3_9STRA|nr:hypothetical protein As57867_015945 [Aphanomyces stellatus]VFT92786.1 Aste57867_16001 [Aphanomyces stellatus]